MLFCFSAQGQADYSAAWAAYYQQLYQQQAAAAAGQAAPGMMTKTIFLAGTGCNEIKVYSKITQPRGHLQWAERRTTRKYYLFDHGLWTTLASSL